VRRSAYGGQRLNADDEPVEGLFDLAPCTTRLDEIDIGNKLSNRPDASVQAIDVNAAHALDTRTQVSPCSFGEVEVGIVEIDADPGQACAR
jgi:hypothetical protein